MDAFYEVAGIIILTIIIIPMTIIIMSPFCIIAYCLCMCCCGLRVPVEPREQINIQFTRLS